MSEPRNAKLPRLSIPLAASANPVDERQQLTFGLPSKGYDEVRERMGRTMKARTLQGQAPLQHVGLVAVGRAKRRPPSTR